MFNKLRSSLGKNNASNISKNISFADKLKYIKTGVFSAFMIISSNVFASNNTENTTGLETGDSFSQALGTKIKIQGVLNDFGVRSLSLDTISKIMQSKSVTETFSFLGLNSTNEGRMNALTKLLPDYKLETSRMHFDANMKLNQKIQELLTLELNKSENEQIESLKILIAGDSNIQNKSTEHNGVVGLNSADAKIISDHVDQLQKNQLNGGYSNSEYVAAVDFVTGLKKQTSLTDENKKTLERHLAIGSTKVDQQQQVISGPKFQAGENSNISVGQSGANLQHHTEYGNINAQLGENGGVNYSKNITGNNFVAEVGANVGYSMDQFSFDVNGNIIYGNEEDKNRWGLLAEFSLSKYDKLAYVKGAKELDFNTPGSHVFSGSYAEYSKAGNIFTIPETSEEHEYELNQSSYGFGYDYLFDTLGASKLESIGLHYARHYVGDVDFPSFIKLSDNEGTIINNQTVLADGTIRAEKIMYFVQGGVNKKISLTFSYKPTELIRLSGSIDYSKTIWEQRGNLEASSESELGGTAKLEVLSNFAGNDVKSFAEYQHAQSNSSLKLGSEMYHKQHKFGFELGYIDYKGFLKDEFTGELTYTYTFGANAPSLDFSNNFKSLLQTKNAGVGEKKIHVITRTGKEVETLGDVKCDITPGSYCDIIAGADVNNPLINLYINVEGGANSQFLSNLDSIEADTSKIAIEEGANGKKYLVLKNINNNFKNLGINFIQFAVENGENVYELLEIDHSLNVDAKVVNKANVSLSKAFADRTSDVGYESSEIDQLLTGLFDALQKSNILQKSANKTSANTTSNVKDLGGLSISTLNNIFNGAINISIIRKGFLASPQLISPVVLNYISDNVGSIDQEELLLSIQNGTVITTGIIDDNIHKGPTAVDDIFTVMEDGSFDFSFTDLTANDNSDEHITVTNINNTAISNGTVINTTHGKITISAIGGNYKPNADVSNVEDTFTYTVTDTKGKVSNAKVTVKITEVNDIPVIIVERIQLIEDVKKVYSFDQIATDIDNTLTKENFTILRQPTNGVVNITDSGIEFLGNKDAAGDFTFEIQVNDGDNVVTKVISGNIENVNDAPFTKDFTEVIEVSETGEERINLLEKLFGDVDLAYGDSLTFSIQGNANNAVIEGNELVIKGFDVNADTEFTVSVIATDIAGEQVGNSVDVKVNVTPDGNTVIVAPTLESKTHNSIDVTDGTFTDIDGVQNVTVELFSDAGLTTSVGTNVNGVFSGLTANTTYYAIVKGEAFNASTGLYEAKQSSSLSITTDVTPNTAPVVSNFTSITAGQSGSISKSGEIDGNIFDAEQTDSQLTVVGVVGEVGKITSAIVNGSGGIDWVAENNFEGVATITYGANDGFVNSNTGTITVNADKKTPVFGSHNISGLDTQNQACSNQSITTTDFSDLASANIQFVDLFTGNPVGGQITNLRYSGKTVTFDCVTPSVENVKIVASFTDAHANTSNVVDIEVLTLSPENQAPVLSQTTFNFNHGGISNNATINVGSVVTDDNDNDNALTIIITQAPLTGVISEESGTSFKFTRTDGGAGDDVVKIKLRDTNGLESAELTVQLIDFDDVW